MGISVGHLFITNRSRNCVVCFTFDPLGRRARSVALFFDILIPAMVLGHDKGREHKAGGETKATAEMQRPGHQLAILESNGDQPRGLSDGQGGDCDRLARGWP